MTDADNDDEPDFDHPLLKEMDEAISRALTGIEGKEYGALEVAYLLATALCFCGDFGRNVKLLADIDTEIEAEEEKRSKYDA